MKEIKSLITIYALQVKRERKECVMKKNIVVSIVTIILVILIIISFVFYTKSNSKEPSLEEKVSDEIKYLNSYLVSLLGHFNGITVGSEVFQTSQPKTQLGKMKENNPQNTDGQNSSSESGQTGQENNNSSETNGTEGNGKTQGNQTKGNSENRANLTQNGIFANQGNYEPDWETIRLTG